MKMTTTENKNISVISTEKFTSVKNGEGILADLLLETNDMYFGEDYLVNAYEIVKTSPIYEEI